MSIQTNTPSVGFTTLHAETTAYLPDQVLDLGGMTQGEIDAAIAAFFAQDVLHKADVLDAFSRFTGLTSTDLEAFFDGSMT